MNRLKFIFLVIVLFLMESSFGQSHFIKWDTITVVQSGDSLLHPFAGGFNNPQFSEVDLNGDGIKDLFVFDRSTSKIFTFLNGGTANKVDYSYAPNYSSLFPDMTDWVLLVDYNCDGKEDIFTGRSNSITVYRNDYTLANGLKFTHITSFEDTEIYIASTDIPAISDIDDDGDIDILTFDPGGSTMFYFKNHSIENYGSCDSLEFLLTDQCWGKFMEAFGNCSITMNISCKRDNSQAGEIHAGSTTLALDLDGNNTKELIIGDLTCNNAKMLTNGGTLSSANITAADSLYPAFNPIDIYRFPAAFYLDVDNDGLKDLIAAPNGKNVSENFTGTLLYKNTGSSAIPNFVFQSNAFLQNEMIEVGAGANPVFFDYNADSLPDIIIGNYGYFSPAGNYLSQLALYENTGTTNAPTFNLITRDYASLSSLNLNGIYPAFEDLDDDGDVDLIIGDYNGNLHYFENNAGKGNPANLILTQALFAGIDVGQFATPQVVDVNRDGKLDLLIGERAGTINYFENKGTITSPVFSAIPTNDFFGEIDVMIPCCTGYSSPFLTILDTTGEYSLLVGTESGYIYHYSGIDNNLSGIFTLKDTLFSNINEGERISISGADLNANGAIDLIVGNNGGGIALFQNYGPSIAPWEVPVDSLPFSISVFPNPVSDFLKIKITGLEKEDVVKIKIFNLLGQEIYSRELAATFNQWVFPVDIRGLAGGLYFIKVTVSAKSLEGNQSHLLKFMVWK